MNYKKLNSRNLRCRNCQASWVSAVSYLFIKLCGRCSIWFKDTSTPDWRVNLPLQLQLKSHLSPRRIVFTFPYDFAWICTIWQKDNSFKIIGASKFVRLTFKHHGIWAITAFSLSVAWRSDRRSSNLYPLLSGVTICCHFHLKTTAVHQGFLIHFHGMSWQISPFLSGLFWSQLKAGYRFSSYT